MPPPLFLETWWVSMFPLVFLLLAIFAFSVVSDAFQNTLDPRGET